MDLEALAVWAVIIGTALYLIPWERRRQAEYREERDAARAAIASRRGVGRVGRKAVGVQHLVEGVDTPHDGAQPL